MPRSSTPEAAASSGIYNFILTLLASAGAVAALLALIMLPTESFAQTAQTKAPGPSAWLHAHPYYQCTTNYYVATSGNDSNSGTQGQPWLTLQKANNALPTNGSAAGTCINVAPGTYSAGVLLTAGGNFAANNGYVTWRCQAFLSCIITANGGPWAPAFAIKGAYGPNYIIIDGFVLAANQAVTYGNGVLITSNPSGAPNGRPSSHHVWIINNVAHGFGEAGIAINAADWVYVMHNRTFNNAMVTCDAQGSGIGIVVPKAAANYTPTEDDQTWAPFHQVIGWNMAWNNELTKCGNASNPYDTDGNGIIMDTFNGSGVDNVLYPYQTLVTNNLAFKNGGKGIAVFRSAYITVANNTAYNNNLDPWNSGFPRGEINNAGGFNNKYYNNVVLALPAASPADPRCKGANYDIQPAPCPLMANVSFLGGNSAGVTDSGNIWQSNINVGGAAPWGWGPNGNVMLGQDATSFTCQSNKCEVNPMLNNPTTANFALLPSSPAIGYGVVLTAMLPDAVDAGACNHALVACY